MTLANFLSEAEKKLAHIYEPRELKNILSIIIEDTWGFSKKQQRLLRNENLSEEQLAEMEKILEQLLRNEPVQYVLGSCDFYGMKLKVNQNVLIPRPETEELIHYAIENMVAKKLKSPKIIDIGTGSGCIAIALKKVFPDAEVCAADVSEKALEIAKENAEANKTEIKFLHLDFLNEKNWSSMEKYDLIISNPPYVTAEEFDNLMPRVKNFEPRSALIADDVDPFIFYEKIARFAEKYLRENGVVFLEINSAKAKQIQKYFQKFKTEIIKDLQGNDRIISAERV